jgi:protein involved in sex pheromone biosynthesis
MKKVLSIVAVAGMLAVIACGPSAEEKRKAEEKRIQDSIESAEKEAAALEALEAEAAVVDTTATEAAPAAEVK